MYLQWPAPEVVASHFLFVFTHQGVNVVAAVLPWLTSLAVFCCSCAIGSTGGVRPSLTKTLRTPAGKSRKWAFWRKITICGSGLENLVVLLGFLAIVTMVGQEFDSRAAWISTIPS